MAEFTSVAAQTVAAKGNVVDIMLNPQKKKKNIDKYNTLFRTAIKMGIYEELKSSLLPNPPRGKTLEEYMKLASPYPTRGQFKKAHPGAYEVIISKEGWAEKCFVHMKKE